MKIQNLLHILSEKYEEKGKENADKTSTKPKEKNKEKPKEVRRGGARGRARRGQGTRTTSTSASSAEVEGNSMGSDEKEGEDASGTQATPMDTSENEETNAQDESSFDFHAHQGLAALGVAVIAMGEEIGLDMAFRMFGHLVRLICPFWYNPTISRLPDF